MRNRSLLLALSLLCIGCPHVTGEPIKGGVHEESTSCTPQTPQSALLDQLQAQVNELKQLNAKLEKAASGEREPTMVFPAKIDAVDSNIRKGKLFAEADLPQQDTEEGWYRIPYWRAGRYRREKQVDHSITGDVTIVSKVDHVYGMQVDKSDGIWHYSSWPHITKVETGRYYEYKIIDKYEPVDGAPNEFAFRVRSTDIDVNKKTNRIERVTRQEEVDRYTPVTEGSGAVGECEWQSYTSDGNPNSQVTRSSVEEVQTEPFKVANFWNKRNLRESFIRYLQSHGKADLIPD
jgi:hypothetical protein